MNNNLAIYEKVLTIFATVGLVAVFFVPTMIASANSLGCRYQDLRPQAVMPPTPQDLFCVLHWSEGFLVVFALLIQLIRILSYILPLRIDRELSLMSISSLTVPFIDLTYIGLRQKPLQYGLTYQFTTGYWIFLVVTVFMTIATGINLRSETSDMKSKNTE